MEFAPLVRAALLFGLIAGCSHSTSDTPSANSAPGMNRAPEWALDSSPDPSQAAAQPTQPIPDADEVVIADDASPAVKPIPDEKD